MQNEKLELCDMSPKFLDNIINTIGSPVFVKNEQSEFVFVNQPFCDFIGISQEDILGKMLSDSLPEDQMKYLLEVDAKVISSGQAHTYERLFTRSDGKILTVVIKKTRFIDDQGDKFLVGIFHDITEQKHYEQVISEFNQTLEMQVHARTGQLNKLMKELEFRNEELQQFIYVASHDMSEPLLTLSSFSNLLRDEYAEKFDETGNKCIDFIFDAATRMRAQIKSLLDYLVLSNNVPLTMVDCTALVDNVLLDLSCIIQETSAHINVQKLPSILGNETELRLLFQHLITNAIKFRQPDVCPEIHISVQRDNNSYIFLIADNGIGIDKQHQNRVFHIFKQTHKRGMYDGFGMGLSYCKKIITKYGGKIWVKSELGKGSRFYFSIPLGS